MGKSKYRSRLRNRYDDDSIRHSAEKALDAAEILKEQGILVRVLDMATIKPLDHEVVIKAARETGAIMTIEDHTILGGLGSAVAEVHG